MAGVKGRSGRRPDSQVAHFKELIDKIWTEERREKCLTILIDDSESSDFAIRNESRKLLYAYTYGKPTEKHQHEGVDGNPLEIIVTHVSKPSDSPD